MQRLLQDGHPWVERNNVGWQIGVGVDDKGNAPVSETCRYGRGVPIVKMEIQDGTSYCFVLEQ